MIETSAVLAGFTFTVVSAHFWPLAMTAILGYLVNSAVRTLLFGYFGRKIYRPGLHFSLASVAPNLRFGAWLTADSIINYLNTNLQRWCWRVFSALAWLGDTTWRTTWPLCHR